MKYFVALLLGFNAFFGANQLLGKEIKQHLKYSWRGNEKDLYLKIKVANGIEFPEDYLSFSTKNGNGQGCEIVCKPVEQGTVFSPNGHELIETTLTVILSNIENPNKIAYTAILRDSYRGINEKGILVESAVESKKEGLLNNPSLKLTKAPIFFTIHNRSHKAAIRFKNTFKYPDVE